MRSGSTGSGTVPKDKIACYYNAADILVMPSVSKPADGLNVCVLDAMSCAKPVVGSDVAGNELAIADGETGYIVPEQNPAALADALASLAHDRSRRQRMGRPDTGELSRNWGGQVSPGATSTTFTG